ncbi:hypothetical protein BGX31_002275, partial [Mortierella sp. GBA43]
SPEQAGRCGPRSDSSSPFINGFTPESIQRCIIEATIRDGMNATCCQDLIPNGLVLLPATQDNEPLSHSSNRNSRNNSCGRIMTDVELFTSMTPADERVSYLTNPCTSTNTTLTAPPTPSAPTTSAMSTPSMQSNCQMVTPSYTPTASPSVGSHLPSPSGSFQGQSMVAPGPSLAAEMSCSPLAMTNA